MMDKLDGDASLDATRVPLMISDEDRDGFVRQAQREGMTLSE